MDDITILVAIWALTMFSIAIILTVRFIIAYRRDRSEPPYKLKLGKTVDAAMKSIQNHESQEADKGQNNHHKE